MDPREEQADLIDNPIPIQEQDKILPTRIAHCDKEISEKREELANLEREREILLNHAVKLGCLEDMRYRIEQQEVRGNRVADPVKLRADFPNEWQSYVAVVTNKVERESAQKKEVALAKIEKDVNLGIADKIFGKKNVDERSSVPVSHTWVIVKKEA